MSEEEIKLNLDKTKKVFNNFIKWIKQDKVLKVILILLLIGIIIAGVWIRTQNLSLLKDHTTGKYIPLALDPFYWLRIAQTIVSQGSLPAVDSLRHLSGGIGFSNEITPWVIILIYKVGHIFNNNISLQFADVIYPVIAFILGFIAFYFLVHALTKSKVAALISSAFLAMIPTYLYRTMAGFADHDALGTLFFFLTLLVYTYALKWLDKDKHKENNKILSRKNLMVGGLFGLGVGFLSALTLASWGGIANLIPMIIPLSFIIFWILKVKDLDSEKKNLPKFLIFYISFVIFSIISGPIFNFSLASNLNRFLLSTFSLLNSLTLMFIIFDFLIIKYMSKIPIKNLNKYHLLWSLGLAFVMGFLILIFHKNLFSSTDTIINRLLHPFGTDRVSLTVAENQQPYISTWISQLGSIFFWLFFAGVLTIGINISRWIKKTKSKIWFVILWIFLISGVLLSRISPSSILNGTNFISKLFYFGGIITFLIYSIKLYIKDKVNIPSELLIIFALTFIMLIAARGAARLIFSVTSFACLSVGYLIFNLGTYFKKSKEDILKMILAILLIGAIIASIFSFNSFVRASINQAKYTGPSAGYQWQNAMAWVRSNTPINAVFIHWWDYGYWVEYLGQRATVADGGHFEGAFRDHLIGRYLLTEPIPNLALSFMKSNNVSYLLIDPTDLGKYPAYSIIGSDTSGKDRYSSVPIMPLNQKQTQTEGNSTIRVYQNVIPIDQDIVYNLSNGQQIFMPRGKAFIIGVILNITKNNNSITFNQPKEVLYYNKQQMKIPLRYVYYNNKLIDFKNGYGGAYVLSRVNQKGGRVQIDNFGAIIYLSPKVFNSLFAQLYLMNDPLNKYSTIKLAHAQYGGVLQALRNQGFIKDFVYYNGFRGPIKIWKIKYPSNILSKEEFTMGLGKYAEFDNLTVTK